MGMAELQTTSASAAAESAELESRELDIGGAVASGIKWKVASQLISEGSRVVVTVILARLLSPADYGIAGMALVCATFVGVFTDPALGSALLQRRQISEADRSTVFWTTVGTGTLTMVIGIALSGVVADLFGEPQVQNLFIVLSVTFFISGFTVTQTALLWRSLSYRSLEIREIGSTLVAAVCAVTVALAGFGPWAIITNQVVFAATSGLLIWVLSPWRPRFMFSKKSLRDLGGFGAGVFGARVLSWGTMNMDNALVGRYLGPAALGAYGLAYNVMFLPMVRIATPIAGVLSPAYARMQDDLPRLEEVWLKSKRASVMVLAPAFLGCIVVAPDLIPVAFGPKWHAAVVPLQLLSLAGLATALVTLHWGILTALGKGGTLLWLNIVVGVVTIISFFAGVSFGIVGVAGFYAIARWVLVPVDVWITTRAIAFEFWKTMRAGLGVLPVGLVAAGVAFGLRRLLVDNGVPPAIRLFAVGAVMLLVYAIVVRLVFPDQVEELIGVVRRRRQARSGSTVKAADPA
jgi:O-antigen/teichoic acid export membrane protein